MGRKVARWHSPLKRDRGELALLANDDPTSTGRHLGSDQSDRGGEESFHTLKVEKRETDERMRYQ